MARKVITVELEDGEQTLTFEIKQMSATQREDWIARAFFLLAKSGANLPMQGETVDKAELVRRGFEGIARLDYAEVKPLYNDLLKGCQRILEGGARQAVTLETLDGYVDEFTTILKLRFEVLKLNFQSAAKGSPFNLGGMQAAMK